MTELQPLKFTDSVNNIEFRVQGDTAPQEIIRLDSKGFHYRGQLIEDAGEAHRLMVEFLKQSTQSQTEPVAPSNKEVVELVARLRDWRSVPLLSERERAAALLERLASDNAGLAAAADSLYADNMSLLDNHHD